MGNAQSWRRIPHLEVNASQANDQRKDHWQGLIFRHYKYPEKTDPLPTIVKIADRTFYEMAHDILGAHANSLLDLDKVSED